jgi:death-on-curing protein
MKLTLFPTLDETLELQKRLIDRFGGIHGIRDLGLLQSAISRPQTGYYGSLSEQAAALMQSLATNHAFLDGNKRVAFALTAIFLRINGFKLQLDKDHGVDEAESFIVEKVINAKVDLQTITLWLEQRMRIKK